MPWVQRTAYPETDYEFVARLQSQCEGQCLTAEDLCVLDAHSDLGRDLLRVVGEADGALVACGQATHSIWHPPGLFRLDVCVEQAHRRQGMGRLLIVHLEAFALEQGATELESRCSDAETGSRLFLDVMGYAQVAHTCEAVLDLRHFEPPDDAPLGRFRFFTLAETPLEEEQIRRLWDLNTETSRDEPLNDPDFRPTFEQYRESVVLAPWFDPHGQFIAADGDDWVAMSAVGQVSGGSYYNFFTGVRRSHRGLGLAKALKMRAARCVRGRGAPSLKTHNDSRNAPMLAVNTALGYRPGPGWLVMRKRLIRS